MMPSASASQARFFKLYALSALILMMLMLAVSVQLHAQDTPHYDAFFIAPSEGLLDQVWGLTLADTRKDLITHDPWGVANYAISPDQTQIAYVNSGALWLQPMGGTPEKLTGIEEEAERVSLVFTPDGRSLVYGNKGISIMALDTRTSETLLTDVYYEETNDPAQIWDYSPVRFLSEDRLLVEIGLWEGRSAAIYDLPSRTLLQTKDLYNSLNIKPLTDGRYLYYTDTEVGLGIEGFLIGTPSVDPQTPFELLPLLVDEFAANQLTSASIADVVELEPGRIRFTGTGFPADTQGFAFFLGEYDFTAELFMLDVSEDTSAILGSTAYFDMFSPDGQYIAGYANVTASGQQVRGFLTIANLETMNFLALDLPSPTSIMHFQWAGE